MESTVCGVGLSDGISCWIGDIDCRVTVGQTSVIRRAYWRRCGGKGVGPLGCGAVGILRGLLIVVRELCILVLGTLLASFRGLLAHLAGLRAGLW
mgnify:CR=1 FL=1